MPADESGKVAGVEDQELAAVAGLVPALPNIRVAHADRFAQAVRALVEKRAQQGWPREATDDMAVFVLVDYPRSLGETYGGQPFVDPSAQCTPLLGHMFFSSADGTHGQFIPIPTEPNAVLEWLDDRGLGDRPIVTAYRKERELVTRRYGLSGRAEIDEIRDHKPSATVQELVDALTLYHQRRVMTPAGCPSGVWKQDSAHQYIPGPQPERTIQSDLALALDFWFQDAVRVEIEDNTNIGRIDVRLLKKDANAPLAYWIILELKVIKSFTSSNSPVYPSDNVDAIVKGVKQAGAYRENRGAEAGRLEIYDLRKDKSEDLTDREDVLAALAVFSPRPRIDTWPAFGSAEDARNAGYSG